MGFPLMPPVGHIPTFTATAEVLIFDALTLRHVSDAATRETLDSLIDHIERVDSWFGRPQPDWFIRSWFARFDAFKRGDQAHSNGNRIAVTYQPRNGDQEVSLLI